MANIMNPIVNINGDSRKTLVDTRIATIRAIEELMKALQETKPHGRNYLGDTERYNADLLIYGTRFNALDKMRNEIQEEALAIHNADHGKAL
jgi:hypothetical protein